MSKSSPWARRWARLHSMGGEELLDRVRQHLQARIDAYRSTRGFDFAQDLAGTGPDPQGRFFFDEPQVSEICRLLRGRMPEAAAQIVASAEKICRHRFDLLGFADLNYGPEIDWHLDLVHGKRAPRIPWFKIGYLDFAQVGDAKITWELNRHQHLVTLAKAYRLTGQQEFADAAIRQWRHWLRENPYPIGVNWASSLEVAFRSLSWIWTFFLLQSSPVMTAELRLAWARVLALNGRHIDTYLSTFFSPNTHLLGEAVALFFIGTLFPGLRPAARWQERGWNAVLAAARDQVRDDGFYFEQSAYYHVYALDFFLHARVLAAANGIAIPARFDAVVQRMLDALLLLGRAGIVPQLGDDDGGRVFDPRRNQARELLDPLTTGAVLFQRGDFKFLGGRLREETLWLLGPAGLAAFEEMPSTDPSSASTHLPDSGLYLMADADRGQQRADAAGRSRHAGIHRIELCRSLLLSRHGGAQHLARRWTGPGPGRWSVRLDSPAHGENATLGNRTILQPVRRQPRWISPPGRTRDASPVGVSSEVKILAGARPGRGFGNPCAGVELAPGRHPGPGLGPRLRVWQPPGKLCAHNHRRAQLVAERASRILVAGLWAAGAGDRADVCENGQPSRRICHLTVVQRQRTARNRTSGGDGSGAVGLRVSLHRGGRGTLLLLS